MGDISQCQNSTQLDEKIPDDAIDILESLLKDGQDTKSDTYIDQKENSGVIQGKAQRSSVIHNGDTDSSDDDENRNCMDQKYNSFGRSIKSVLADKDNNAKDHSFLQNGAADRFRQPVWKTIGSSSLHHASVSEKPINKEKIDVYTDPIFGIRIIKPVVSSQQLREKMLGRNAIPMSKVKYHVQHGDVKNDWVIGGVIVRKSPIRTSQKGSQFCIWKLCDLREGLKTISLFLFRNSHKNLWKTAVGTVVGVLNPGVLENRDDREDEATLSVDNAQRVMILGLSKDLGTCKSRKKNGDSCTAFVNTNKCEYCIFHVQQEYKKCSRRSELQSPGLTGLRNKILGKNEVFYGGQSFTAIPAKVNRKQVTKDRGVLERLSGGSMATPKTQTLLTQCFKTSSVVDQMSKPALNQFDASRKQSRKDQARLKSLTVGNAALSHSRMAVAMNRKTEAPTALMAPKLEEKAKINLNSPISRFHVDRAKMNALLWVKRNGPFVKENPNDIKAISIESGKRALESESSASDDTKKICKRDLNQDVKEGTGDSAVSKMSKFQQLLEAKSKHTDLLEAKDEQAQEDYFTTLEKKEKMEEKMLTTYKVACKAVRCLKCRYTSFSASDMCKTLGHPLKVTDSVKRFFSCRDCGNRTVSLELIPLLTCKQCGGSHWQRAPMMRERKANLSVEVLSIRGGEETFIGSVQADGNLNLLVPE